MAHRDTKFLKSGTMSDHFPEPTRPEIIVLGRSNAGKSSFLNAVAGRDIANVSQKPGRTRLLNFFDIGQYYRLVDCPGYGYAKRSKTEQFDWQPLMEAYLKERENLVGAVLLIDVKRELEEEETNLVQWLGMYNIPTVIGLTKADKIGVSESRKALSNAQNILQNKDVFLISNTKKMGISDLEGYIFTNWIKARA